MNKNFKSSENNNNKKESKAAEREASRDGWKPEYHSLFLSFLAFTCLTCLSTPYLSVCPLPVCLTVQVSLSVLQRKQKKGASPRMAVGTKGSAIRTRQQQTDRERDKQTGQKRIEKRGKRRVSTLHVCWAELRLSVG